MFDLSSGKLILIGVIALIVVGPKELPGLLRQVGRATAKLRQMAGEFRSQFDEAMREAELADVQKQLTGAVDSATEGVKSNLDPLTSIRNDIQDAVTGATAEAQAAVAAVDAAGPGVAVDLPPPPEPEPLSLAGIDTPSADMPSILAPVAEPAAGEPVSEEKPKRKRRKVAEETVAGETPTLVVDAAEEEPAKPKRRRKVADGESAA